MSLPEKKAAYKDELLSRHIGRRIDGILSMWDEGLRKAILAKLRRGVGRAPGDVPEIWSTVLSGMPEALMSTTDEPSYAEQAACIVLPLFALHQQGHDPIDAPMHKKDMPLGQAVRMLAEKDTDSDSVDAQDRALRRLQMVATTSNLSETARYLRAIVQLLRQKDIPLDYAALAKDLYWYQFPEHASDVRLGWGREFYRDRKKNAETSEKDGAATEKGEDK